MAYKLKTFHGSVVRFWRDRAYGYVRIDGNGRTAHFNLRDFDHVGGDEIKEGSRLEFYLTDGPKGLTAIRCSIVK